MHWATRMLKQFESGTTFARSTKWTLRTSTGGMITVEITDRIQVSNSKVAKQKIYYDPRDFVKAFGIG